MRVSDDVFCPGRWRIVGVVGSDRHVDEVKSAGKMNPRSIVNK